MHKFKWWQWCLIIVIGISTIGATIDVITGRNAASMKGDNGYRLTNAKFKVLSGNAVFALTFNPQIDPDALPEIAREHCGSRVYCNVLGWTDPKFTAKGFPMTDRETAQVKFMYTVVRANGLEQVLWDCRTWKRANKDHCLSFN